jgi:Zn-dependent peptidase ImmA (M78 family)/transcriptional regulator with XRE-family HTH domain
MANSWEELGRQVASARKDQGLSQAELAAELDVDRTAITKMESGERKIDTFELARLAKILRRPIHWFVNEPSPAIVSRRNARAEDEAKTRVEDIALETLALDVEQLEGLGVLEPKVFPASTVISVDAAEAEARKVRERAVLGLDEPVWNLVDVAERLGLYAFVLSVEADVGGPSEGSYVALKRGGVALISASGPSGRRRFTIVHELGHHVLADEYAPEWVVGAGSGEHEKIINAFAIHFLFPREAIQKRWVKYGGPADPRSAAIKLAAEFGLSWTAACAQLERFGYLDHAMYKQLVAVVPNDVDFMEQQVTIRDDVAGPRVPPGYGAAVIRALKKGQIAPARAIELLRGTIDRRDLPVPHELSLDEMTAELLEPIP